MISLPARPTLLRLIALLALTLLIASCAGNPAIKEAREQFDAGSSEAGLQILEKAARENPQNLAYRSEYFRRRELTIAQWLAQAESARLSGQHEAAGVLYRRVQAHDPQNARARSGLATLEVERRHRTTFANAEMLVRDGKFTEARDVLRPLLNENPNHRDARRLQREIDDKTIKPALVTPRIRTLSTKPISLELRDVTLRAVFDVISQGTGVSFVFDRDVRADQRVTIAVRNSPPEELIQLALSSNQLDQKLVNETTILVYPNTPQKQREYRELVIRAFYLNNAEVKQTANMIRTLLKTRDIFFDEKINMLVIKDTPEAIRMAEKLVNAHDLADPEVMLEVEVLEIASSRLLELGLKFPDSLAVRLVGGSTSTTSTTVGGATTLSTDNTGTPGVFSLRERLSGPRRNLVRFTVPNPFLC